MDEINSQEYNNQEPEGINNYEQPNPVQPSYNNYIPASDPQAVNISFSIKELRSMSGWITFRAVINIIVGSLTCLGSILSLLVSLATFISGKTTTNTITAYGLTAGSALIYLIIGFASPFIGVLLIITGVKLLNASDSIKRYIVSNDITKIPDSFNSIGKYFKLFGITTIIKICMGLILTLMMIAMLVSIIPKIENQFPF